MANVATVDWLNELVKERYASGADDAVYADPRIINLFKMDENHVGKYFDVPLIDTGHTGGSVRDFATALANHSALEAVEFHINRAKLYDFITVDGEALRAVKKDMGAFINAREEEINHTFKAMRRAMAAEIWGDGYGVLGEIASVAGATTTVDSKTTREVALSNKGDVRKFERNMVIRDILNASGKGGAQQAQKLVVCARDEGAGSLFISQTDGGDPAATLNATDYLVQDGHGLDGGSPNMVQGIPAWLERHSLITSSDSFNNVNRFREKTRLAGVEMDGTGGGALRDKLIDFGTRLELFGASPDFLVCAPQVRGALAKELDAQVEYTKMDRAGSREAVIDFRAIVVDTGAGPLPVLTDPYCPNDAFYAIDKSTWTVHSAGGVPGFLNHGDTPFQKREGSDEILAALGGYWNLSCKNPGANGKLLIDPVSI